jgi:tetratricopeptide (TPR) repeat protein
MKLMNAKPGAFAGRALTGLALAACVWTAPSYGQSEGVDAKFRDGNAAFRAGQLDTAAQDFSAVTKLAPHLAEGYMNLALVQERQGKTSEEIASLQAALRLKPALKGANLFLGIACFHQDKFAQARAALEQEVKLSPNDPKALMWLGIVDSASNDPESAITVLNKAAQIAPKDEDILYNRGRAALLLSEKSYQQIFQLNQNSWRVHQVLAQAFSESDRHSQAISEYKSAIALAPNEPELYESLGNEYWNGSQLELAEQQFSKEVEMDPENAMALYYLGSIRVERDNSKDGVPPLQRALELNPNIADASYHLGRGQIALGQDESAVSSFENAIKSDPGSDLAQRSYYELAIAYRRLQKPEDSRAALEQFKQLKAQADAKKAKNLEEIKKMHEKADDKNSQASAAQSQEIPPQ